MAKKKTKAEGKQEAPSTAVTGKVEQLKEFVSQSQVELKKVTWPSRRETIATSAVVLVFVIVMSLFLGLVDLGLAKLIQAILS